ncbi:MAG: GDP-L-galactose phosphorylase 1-like protein [Monoraphidium minutum]|nr:MAG: GDP-L-galactose phosphorylase 1-like protein [Monoraphidium minutum]
MGVYRFSTAPGSEAPRLGRVGGAARGADSSTPVAEASLPPLGAAAAAGAPLARGPQDAAAPGRALLDGLLLAHWEDAAAKGLFRYDVTACPTKVLPGSLGFIAQLNEGRATKKRPTEFRLDQVCQPFDPAKFHFNKAALHEAFFAFEPAPPAAAASAFAPAGRLGPSPNLVLINVSPIDYGHVLLCPRVLDNLPQLLDRESVLLALRFAREGGNPFLRVGYNSLGAYATINHLHFQSYYLNTQMPIERAGSAPLPGVPSLLPGGVAVSRLFGYPVNAFALAAPRGGGAAALEALADAVTAAALALQAANVPHNMLISECGAKVFLTPQCYAEKQAKGVVPDHLLATGVNPAVWEITGHMVLFRQGDYDSFSQQLAWDLLAEVSLEEGRFLEVAAMCFGGGAGGGGARRASECGAEAEGGARAGGEAAAAAVQA